MFGNHARDLSLIGVWIRACQPLRDHIESRFRLLRRHARFQRGQHAQLRVASIGEQRRVPEGDAVHPDWDVGVEFNDRVRAVERLRYDADDRHRLPVQRHGLSDYAWVAAEAPHPVTVAEHDDRASLRFVAFARSDQSSARRLNTEHAKKLLGTYAITMRSA